MNARIIITLLLFSMQLSHAQEITTSATCGKCGRIVSSGSRVGDRCPYCHVVWNQENTRRYSTTAESPKYNYGSSERGDEAFNKPQLYFKLKNSSAIYYRDYYGTEVGGLVYQKHRFTGSEIKNQYAFIQYSNEDGGAAIGWVKLSDLVTADKVNEEIDYKALIERLSDESYERTTREGKDPFDSKFEVINPENDGAPIDSENNTIDIDTVTSGSDADQSSEVNATTSTNEFSGDGSAKGTQKSIEQLAAEEGTRVYWSSLFRNLLIVVGGSILIFLFKQGSKPKSS